MDEIKRRYSEATIESFNKNYNFLAFTLNTLESCNRAKIVEVSVCNNIKTPKSVITAKIDSEVMTFTVTSSGIKVSYK